MKTILVVDDDDGIRALLRRVLESMGHRVEEAGSAVDALEVLNRCPVDLALCDVMMPGRDGVWLTEQIRSRHPGVRVALATGLMEMDPTLTLRPGVVGYIVKPFRRQALADLLESAFKPMPSPVWTQIDFDAIEAL